MHPDQELIERLAHGELDTEAGRAVGEHLLTCPGCQERLARVRREEEEIDALLRHLDHPPPRPSAHAVVSRGRARGHRWGRWAAGIALATAAAGTAWAAPGSPLPAWLAAARERLDGGRGGATAVERPPSPTAPAGVALDPGRELVIDFTSPQERGRVTVALTDQAQVVVQASVSGATFTSELDRLVIDNARSSADFDILVPRDARRVEVRVRGARVFLKDGESVTTSGTMNAAGAFLLRWTDAAR